MAFIFIVKVSPRFNRTLRLKLGEKKTRKQAVRLNRFKANQIE